MKVSELSIYSATLNNTEGILIKYNEELTLLELHPGPLYQ